MQVERQGVGVGEEKSTGKRKWGRWRGRGGKLVRRSPVLGAVGTPSWTRWAWRGVVGLEPTLEGGVASERI